MTVAVFSPVRQDPAVLALVLASWEAMSAPGGGSLDFWFYDDNDEAESSRLLADFGRRHDARLLSSEHRVPRPGDDDYSRDGHSHTWSSPTIDRIARIKDLALDSFADSGHSHLFLVDSDLVLHPETVRRLADCGADVVSNLFWTQFYEGGPLLPNCWDVHPSRFTTLASVARLREPGTYTVGGLGACTLLSKEAVTRGARFALMPSLDLWGEDRHFCVRASAIGLELQVHTSVPAFHVYTADLLDPARAWFAAGCDPEAWTPGLGRGWETQISERLAAQVAGARSLTGVSRAIRRVRRGAGALRGAVREGWSDD